MYRGILLYASQGHKLGQSFDKRMQHMHTKQIELVFFYTKLTFPLIKTMSPFKYVNISVLGSVHVGPPAGRADVLITELPRTANAASDLYFGLVDYHKMYYHHHVIVCFLN